jgi:hypothetical protein
MGYGEVESTPPAGVPPLFAEHQSANHDEVPGKTGPAFLKIGRYPREGVPGCTRDTPKRGRWHGGIGGTGKSSQCNTCSLPLMFRVRQNGVPGSGTKPDARE